VLLSATLRNLEPLCELGDGLWAPAATTLGMFVCHVTAFTTGSYQLSVFVAVNGEYANRHATNMRSRGALLSEYTMYMEASTSSWADSELQAASLPHLVATTGQMADFQIVARDVYGNVARFPPSSFDFVLALDLLRSANSLSRHTHAHTHTHEHARTSSRRQTFVMTSTSTEQKGGGGAEMKRGKKGSRGRS